MLTVASSISYWYRTSVIMPHIKICYRYSTSLMPTLTKILPVLEPGAEKKDATRALWFNLPSFRKKLPGTLVL
jgi:hypothetical protein